MGNIISTFFESLWPTWRPSQRANRTSSGATRYREETRHTETAFTDADPEWEMSALNGDPQTSHDPEATSREDMRARRAAFLDQKFGPQKTGRKKAGRR